MTLASVAVVGLLVLGNWFANRHSPQWDLTASQRYTLSDQSAKVLGGLQQDVKVTAFFPGGQEDSFVRGTKTSCASTTGARTASRWSSSTLSSTPARPASSRSRATR